MNKQELIKKYEGFREIWNNPGSIPALECFLRDLAQLDEPEKPVIPQFVAEWIENCKTKGYPIFHAFTISYGKTAKWLAIDGNDIVFAMAYGYGYTVEKPKLYTVEIPNPKSMATATILEKHVDGSYKAVSLVFTHDKDWKNKSRNHLTEEEIRKDFEWA